MVRIGFTASEEKSFENVDGRDGRRVCAYAISSHMNLRSGELLIFTPFDAFLKYIIYQIVLRPVTDQLHVTTRKRRCKATNTPQKLFSYEYCFTGEVLRNSRPMSHTCSPE